MNLTEVRSRVLDRCTELQDRDGGYGMYRYGGGKRTDLYSSCDFAITRTVVGERFAESLSNDERAEWIGHINSFALSDGSYTDTHHHSSLHANGMVIAALGTLGGKQPHEVKLYRDFSDPSLVVPWLERIDWGRQWGSSHLFWGGMHCYSRSARCSADWLEAVIAWLDREIDEQSGWWRTGVPHSDRHQGLGGFVHIVPIYEHNRLTFRVPERTIDSVLAMQLPSGRWQESKSPHVMGYLELDALYALRLLPTWAPGYRKEEIRRAVLRYADLVDEYWKLHADELFKLHPHHHLAAVGTFGLLQQLLPDRYPDEVRWSDIFSDSRLYRTAEVETLPEA